MIAIVRNRTTMTVADWQAVVHDMAKVKGWHRGRATPTWVAARLALVHREVSEAVEAVRKSQRKQLGVELADIILRVLCVADKLGIDIELEIARKVAKNSKRKWSLESGLL